MRVIVALPMVVSFDFVGIGQVGHGTNERLGRGALCTSEGLVEPALELTSPQRSEQPESDTPIAINDGSRGESCRDPKTFHVSRCRSRPDRKGDPVWIKERFDLSFCAGVIRRSSVDHDAAGRRRRFA